MLQLLKRASGPSAKGPLVDPGTIGALHGLRFVAAFCILFSHSCTWLANFSDNNAIILFGDFFAVYGMTLFFVLSGFVIHYSYGRIFARERFGEAAYTFFAARFARLYPLFIIFFAVGFLVDGMLSWLTSHRLNLALAVAHALTLTQSWVYIPMFGDRLVLDNGYGLSWSISTEWFFYLSYPLLGRWLLLMKRPRSIVGIAIGLSTFALATLTLCWLYRDNLDLLLRAWFNDPFTDWTHSADRWLFYYSPYIRILEFALGCMSAQLFLSVQGVPISSREDRMARAACYVACCALLLFGSLYIGVRSGSFVEYLAFVRLNFGPAVPLAVIMFCVSRYNSLVLTAVLASPLLIYLGEISYSIYTVHTWTLRIFIRPEVGFTPLLGIEAALRIIAAIGVTLLLSSATYRLIEVPSRRAIRRILSVHPARRVDGEFGQGARIGPAWLTSRSYAWLLATGFCALLIYQFMIVPQFASFTK